MMRRSRMEKVQQREGWGRHVDKKERNCLISHISKDTHTECPMSSHYLTPPKAPHTHTHLILAPASHTVDFCSNCPTQQCFPHITTFPGHLQTCLSFILPLILSQFSSQWQLRRGVHVPPVTCTSCLQLCPTREHIDRPSLKPSMPNWHPARAGRVVRVPPTERIMTGPRSPNWSSELQVRPWENQLITRQPTDTRGVRLKSSMCFFHRKNVGPQTSINWYRTHARHHIHAYTRVHTHTHTHAHLLIMLWRCLRGYYGMHFCMCHYNSCEACERNIRPCVH